MRSRCPYCNSYNTGVNIPNGFCFDCNKSYKIIGTEIDWSRLIFIIILFVILFSMGLIK